ncbi:alpha/beta fold hydrolase [Kocuria sediminis]|uniref:Alpha/beta fold hydrolase n=1 Tax=Kocuria sediminis TaxID=1038857 RepID=A0A6N8GHS9_9MICC|nr:alpha/beta fold hydrolase [Kocuria sediminis]
MSRVTDGREESLRPGPGRTGERAGERAAPPATSTGRVRRHPLLRRRRVVVGSHAVDVRGTFDPALPPVVLVHGVGMSGAYFLRLADELAATRDVYALDLPGYGTAPKPPRPLSVAELGEAAAGAVAALGLSGPVLVGHSMGCQIVVDAVSDHPGLCSGYVLVGPTVDPDAPSRPGQAWRLLRDTLREPPRTNALVLRDYLRMGPLRYLRTARSMVRDRIEEDIRGCTVPGLLVRGGRDPIAPRHWVRRLARAAPEARVVEIPGAPHNVQHTHPKELAAACAPFLDACRPARRPDAPA